MSSEEQTNSVKINHRDFTTVVVISGLVGLIYACGLIQRGFVNAGERYYPILFDDALISMRYARNLSLGQGWAWNPGDPPVEGFTNFGWVLWLSLWHLALPDRIAAAWAVLTQGTFLHAMLAAATAYGAGVRHGAAAGLFAGVTVALTWPVAFWSVSGLEVPVMALGSMALVGFAGRAMQVRQLNRRRVWWIWVGVAGCAAGMVLIRMDGLIPVLGLMGAVMLASRRRDLVLLGVLGGAAGLALAGLAVWRLQVFGLTTPNTYYLKMEGFPANWRVARGGIQTGWQVVVGILIPSLLLLVIIRPRWFGMRLTADPQTPPGSILIWAAPALLILAYSAFVGGDAWEGAVPINRFVATAYPMILILIGGMLFPRDYRSGLIPAVAAGILLAGAVSVFPSRQWLPAAARWSLVDGPHDHKIHADLIRAAVQMDSIVPSGALVAVSHAGTVPYYLDRRYHDLLGKCDPVISRTPMHRGVMTRRPYLEFFPGHLKWDYAYSLGQLKPDFILSNWGSTRADAEPYLRDYRLVDGFEAGAVTLHQRIKP
jgi:hypothetical protein